MALRFDEEYRWQYALYERLGLHPDLGGRFGAADGDWIQARMDGASRLEVEIAIRRSAGLPPPDIPPPPPLQRMQVVNGRFRAGDRYLVPRFVSEFDAIPLMWNDGERELRRRFARAKTARCNGFRALGMWGRTTPATQFSPSRQGYWTAAEQAVNLGLEYELYCELPFFADAQELYPRHADRVALLRDYIVFCLAHPSVLPQLANEPAFNGWTETDDPRFLELADQLKDGLRVFPNVAYSLGDPQDVDINGTTVEDAVQRYQQLARRSNVLVQHGSRLVDPNRYARWVDHLKGFAELLEEARLWGQYAVIHDEPMGMASRFEDGRRDNRIVAHVAGAVVGAMMGGYTCHYISVQNDGTPGLLEGAMAAEIPGSPDYRFINATLGGSPIRSFTGFDKVRTLTNGTDHWAVGYGRAGTLSWGVPQPPALIGQVQDGNAVCELWRAS